ncbi:hypothetical protein CEXT_323831 [Caerostris extrusa]|uniref:Uncharacterized protein n=1 Tax=Caerostris extrusa TaxID=172846 RepID=A0AAV4QN62_CAEEX|nr:hypothetical protein CEXT_323831 [Caerostris extrusa]
MTYATLSYMHRSQHGSSETISYFSARCVTRFFSEFLSIDSVTKRRIYFHLFHRSRCEFFPLPHPFRCVRFPLPFHVPAVTLYIPSLAIDHVNHRRVSSVARACVACF